MEGPRGKLALSDTDHSGQVAALLQELTSGRVVKYEN